MAGNRGTVTPEAHDPQNTRLEIVDAVGNLSDIGQLRKELSRKADELGGDIVCEMTVTPVGDGDQVLVSGLAVKSAELVKCDQQEGADRKWYDQRIDDIREEIDELKELLGYCV